MPQRHKPDFHQAIRHVVRNMAAGKAPKGKDQRAIMHVLATALAPMLGGSPAFGMSRPPDPSLPDPVTSHVGVASWYGPGFHGRLAADGKKFNQNALTAAHRTLPLGSFAWVTDTDTGKRVRVKITDRGPYVNGRVMDLSKGAAKKLGTLDKGLANIGIEPEPTRGR